LAGINTLINFFFFILFYDLFVFILFLDDLLVLLFTLLFISSLLLLSADLSLLFIGYQGFSVLVVLGTLLTR